MENSLPDVVFLAAGDDMLKNNSIDCETKNAAESLNVVKKQPYVCDKCDRAYSVKRELVTHQRVHQGRPTYQCFQCEKEFGTRQLLRKHELWHTGKRSHICTQCGKAFFQKGHLTQHLMIHNGGRPHVCLVCTKTFIFKFDLNRHMKIHQTAASRHSHKKCTEKARPNKRSSANERQNNTGATASSPTNLCSTTAVIHPISIRMRSVQSVQAIVGQLSEADRRTGKTATRTPRPCPQAEHQARPLQSPSGHDHRVLSKFRPTLDRPHQKYCRTIALLAFKHEMIINQRSSMTLFNIVTGAPSKRIVNQSMKFSRAGCSMQNS
ncbi:Zinc finger protein [Trichinella pseudospiralis]|uniref:Zinc finger protein n=1 Tax=Trichinella pseudospiralis TaxID=6337 RepID=A0A0V1EHT7_TRIPS|nr:Zinc finger protein [Trichinella pseudospiralis]